MRLSVDIALRKMAVSEKKCHVYLNGDYYDGAGVGSLIFKILLECKRREKFMINIDYRKETMVALDKFFKEYSEKNSYQTIVWFAAGFALFLQSIFLALPCQLWEPEEDNGFIILMACCMGMAAAGSYLETYIKRIGNEEGNKPFRELMRFLPVSRKQLRFFQMKKLICFQTKVYVVMQLLQLFFTIVCLHQVAWENFVYPFVLAFLLPMAVGALTTTVR